MTRKELLAGKQFKLTTTTWYLKITVAQLKAILAVTRGYRRFGTDRLGCEEGDAERMRLMKKAAVEGGLRISYEEKHNRHNSFYFYFDRDYVDSKGKNVRGVYCISQWDKSTPFFDPAYDRLNVKSPIPKGTPDFDARTNWEWVKKFLNLK